MNIFRLFVYWFLVAGLTLAYFVRHSRILTRLCMSAGEYIWPDFYIGLNSYATRSVSGMTRAEFKRRFGHEMASITNISDGFNVEWLSREYAEFIGFTPDDLNSIEDVIAVTYPDDEHFIINARHRLVNNNATLTKHRIITKDDKLRWILSNSWISNGYIFSIARDITAQEKIKQYPN